MFQAIRALDADIGAVDVIALRDGTYHAELEIVRGEKAVRVDLSLIHISEPTRH